MRVILAFFITISAAAGAMAQSRAVDERLRREIMRLDQAHAAAILKKDTRSLKELIAEDAVTNHPTNKIVRERDGIFELIRNGTINYTSFTREPEEFLFFNETVVVMGNETLTLADGGRTIKRRYTNTWMKRSGKWQLSVRHAHILKRVPNNFAVGLARPSK